jgi:hypothetical protein
MCSTWVRAVLLKLRVLKYSKYPVHQLSKCEIV